MLSGLVFEASGLYGHATVKYYVASSNTFLLYSSVQLLESVPYRPGGAFRTTSAFPNGISSIAVLLIMESRHSCLKVLHGFFPNSELYCLVFKFLRNCYLVPVLCNGHCHKADQTQAGQRDELKL